MKTKALISFVEFTHISEHLRGGEIPGGKYLSAKPMHKEVQNGDNPREKVACKRQVMREMAEYVKVARGQLREKVEKQRVHITALLQLRKTWNLVQEKSGLVLYLGNSRYGASGGDTRIPLSQDRVPLYDLPKSIQCGRVLIVSIDPPTAFLETEGEMRVDRSELELADMHCRDKAIFADLLSQAVSSEEFSILAKSQHRLSVELQSSEVSFSSTVKFEWGDFAGIEPVAKTSLVSLWRKQRESKLKSTLDTYLRIVAHSQVVHFALRTFTDALSHFSSNCYPILKSLSETYTEFAVHVGARRIAQIVVEGTEVRIGLASHILLKIADTTYSGLIPGAMRPVALGELKRVVEISLAAYQKELFGQ